MGCIDCPFVAKWQLHQFLGYTAKAGTSALIQTSNFLWLILQAKQFSIQVGPWLEDC